MVLTAPFGQLVDEFESFIVVRREVFAVQGNTNGVESGFRKAIDVCL